MAKFPPIIHIHCNKCHAPIYMTSALYETLTASGEHFYCMAGHAQRFTETEAVKLKKEVEQLKAEAQRQLAALTGTRDSRDRAFAREIKLDRQISALRGVITRMKNKVKREQ